uniref:hypothetical protein n=1 Tax=uncultured Legionella sp. TaxID=210934 RepID=UPI00262A8F98
FRRARSSVMMFSDVKMKKVWDKQPLSGGLEKRYGGGVRQLSKIERHFMEYSVTVYIGPSH